MRVIHDYQGVPIRLTDERLAHILEHPEMVGLESAIEQTLARPETVIESFSDPQARLYYRYYVGTASATSTCAWSSRSLAMTRLFLQRTSPTGSRGEHRYGPKKSEDLVRLRRGLP